AVAVNAIEGHAGRRFAHVGKQAVEGMLACPAKVPAITDRDAAASIIRIAFVVRVEAALPHADPNIVNTGMVAAPSVAVLGALYPLPPAEASATGCKALAQIASEHDTLLATDTDATPKDGDRMPPAAITLPLRMNCAHGQAPKSPSAEIDQL